MNHREVDPAHPAVRVSRVWVSQRAQYPLIKEYGLNYIGPHIMIEAIFLNKGGIGLSGECGFPG